jgi:hypothetical protein
MNYTSRIKQVEKQAGKGDGTVDITVERCFDRDIEPEYAEYRARQVLGIRLAGEQVQQIYVVGPELEEKHQDMTPEQAKKILSADKDFSHKKMAGDVNK